MLPALLMVPSLCMPYSAEPEPLSRTSTVTPAPTSRVVPEGMVTVPDTVQVSPLHVPVSGEAEQTVEPLEVVIEIEVSAWTEGAEKAKTNSSNPRAGSRGLSGRAGKTMTFVIRGIKIV